MPTREPVQKIQGFGTRLLNRLRSLEMSQTALAEKAKVSRQTLHRAIHRDELTGRVAKQIAGVVGLDLLSMTSTTPPVVVTAVAAHHSTGGSPGAVREPGANYGDDAPLPLSPLGEVLELLRRDVGTTQDDMTTAARISLSTYRRVITGKTVPKDAWLIRWGDDFELRDPEAMLRLKEFTGPSTPFYRAVGRQLHAWRVSNGYDLYDVAGATGEEVLRLAMYEAGLDENFLALDDIAPLLGTSSDVIYRVAKLAAPDDEEEGTWRPPVERVLTFEAAQASARVQQEDRDRDRDEKMWGEEEANELGSIRMRVGLTQKQVARELGRPKKLVAAWENGDREPSLEDLERLALLYRTTPWQLRYGTPWMRAVSFPNAPESRSHIFAAVLPHEARGWLYRFLALLADYGLDDTALESVRDSLTNPDYYYDVQYVYVEDEAVLFLRAKLRELADEVWRNLTAPDWVDHPDRPDDALPVLFTDPGFSVAEGEALVRTLRERGLHAAYRRVDPSWSHPMHPTRPSDGGSAITSPATVGSEPPPPFLADPFSFYYRTKLPVRLLLTDPPRVPYRAMTPGDQDDGSGTGSEPPSEQTGGSHGVT